MSEDRSVAELASQVRLRPMRIADLDVLMRYEQQMFGPEAWSRQGYLDELADTELRHYIVAEGIVAERTVAEGIGVEEPVAEEGVPDHRLLGTGGLLTIGDTAQILTVGVLPSARRRGVGRLLVRALVAEARRRRAGEVLLEVREDNEAARRLYAGEGFAVLGRRRGYYEQGRVDAVTMRYPLQPEGNRS
ncbi:MAG: [ribosomal protein S18]-alanine N-acetyltransferase [Pseudonocardiales bacterium]|jgi:ribosomal-protein-alanine N-acetyltransferase|nr:[ribosomal protein S18]-alanine N-acetyltransferase [Pseudonocardiales bacterium]